MRKENKLAKVLTEMLDLWDSEHPDDPCGCVGASPDALYPPKCTLCAARELLKTP